MIRMTLVHTMRKPLICVCTVVAVAIAPAALAPMAALAQPVSHDGPILVLYAFNEEGALLHEKMTVEKTDQTPAGPVYTGRLSGKEIVLAESGVGLINAAMTTQRMIDSYRPRAVVFSGIAGAIDTSVHIGDIVVCRRWYVHDYGYIGKDGLRHGPTYVRRPPGDSVVKALFFGADSSFCETARALVGTDLKLEPVGGRAPRLMIAGTGVSGNTFIDNIEKRQWLSTTFQALVTDMESAAVAQVCTVDALPFIIFRSASDLAGGSGSESAEKEMEQFFKIAAANSSKVLLAFLGRL
jgi:adenosylhomocysteine nucleosidase